MRLILLLLVALAAPAILAPFVEANTYVVYGCKTRLGAVAPTDGFSPSQTGPVGATSNTCASRGSLTSTLFNMTQNAGARVSWRFSAPPNVEIRQFDVWRNGFTTPGASEFTSEAAQFTTFPGADFSSDRREWCSSAFCLQRGERTHEISGSNQWYSGTLSGVRDVWFSAGCIGSGQCAQRNGGGPMAEMSVQAVQWILVDDHLPTVGTATGKLVGPGPHKGTEEVSFSAADVGSGLFWTKIDIKGPNDSVFNTVQRDFVDRNDGRCVEYDGFVDYPYEFGYTVPCKLSASVDVDFDTTSLTDGDYEMRIRIEDASGNSTVVSPTRSFAVDNIPPPSVTTAPSISGTAKQGGALEGANGAWTGTGNSYATRWLRCTSTELSTCTPIAGAMDDDYFPGADDLGRRLRFEVTATNIEGSTTAVSGPVGPVTNAAGLVPQCADERDNDDDGKIDLADPACSTREGTNEAADTTPAGSFTDPVATPTPAPQPSPTPAGNAPDPETPGGSGNGVNASPRARMTATGSRRRTIGFGRRTQTTISLRDENGAPITGATVVVLQRMNVPGARFVPAHTPVQTDKSGQIPYSALAGYSRTLRFAYKARLSDADYAASHDLTIGVRSKTSLRTSDKSLRNGDTLRFSGRLLSRPVPRSGVVIDLQARVGKRWQSFSTIRTNASGAWKSKYTFRSTTGLQTYVFRARVRGDSAFPYLPSNSRRAKVRVRG